MPEPQSCRAELALQVWLHYSNFISSNTGKGGLK